MKYTIGIISVLSLSFIFFSNVGNQQQRAAATEEQQSGVSIIGVLLGVDGLPEEGTEVLLVEAQVWDLEGKLVLTLPAKSLTIVGMVNDTLEAIIIKGRRRTEAGGRFAFRAAQGRYGVAVAMGSSKNAELLQSEYQQRPVVFDFSSVKEVNLGRVL